MTDVRQTTATLVLGEELDGRFFIRNAAQELVVELYKPRGRTGGARRRAGRLRSAPRADEGASLLAKTQIADGARVVLEARQFGVTRRRSDAAGAAAPTRRGSRSRDATGSKC